MKIMAFSPITSWQIDGETMETVKDDDAAASGSAISGARRKAKSRNPLAQGPQGRGRFNNAEPTVWNGEDLDIPTFIRKNIYLDY